MVDLSAGTVRRVHVVLHRALAQAVRWEWIWHNPASNASPPRLASPEIRPPTPLQIATLLRSVEDVSPALHLFFLLSATTGARRGELLGLRWVDVDLETGNLAIQRAYTEGKAGPVLAPTKNAAHAPGCPRSCESPRPQEVRRQRRCRRRGHASVRLLASCRW